MNYSMLTALLLVSVCVFARVEAHLDINVVACQTSDTDPEDGSELDGDEMDFVDFRNKKGVVTLPDFAIKWEFPGKYEQAMAQHEICKNNLNVAVQAEQNPPETIDPPESTIYSMYKVVQGERNTLICFVNNFYPPPVKVTWTKNNVELKEGVTLSRYYPNSDFTFHQFSTLSVTPEGGDLYSCRVEHKGLSQPQTKIWEPEFQTDSDVAETAFCGIGLTLGLLGVGVGTFFLIKGNNCN